MPEPDVAKALDEERGGLEPGLPGHGVQVRSGQGTLLLEQAGLDALGDAGDDGVVRQVATLPAGRVSGPAAGVGHPFLVRLGGEPGGRDEGGERVPAGLPNAEPDAAGVKILSGGDVVGVHVLSR